MGQAIWQCASFENSFAFYPKRLNVEVGRCLKPCFPFRILQHGFIPIFVAKITQPLLAGFPMVGPIELFTGMYSRELQDVSQTWRGIPRSVLRLSKRLLGLVINKCHSGGAPP